MCASPWCRNPATCTAFYNNFPLPPAPARPDRSQVVDRHAGMWCGCMLLDCCHNEMPEDNCEFRRCTWGRHVDSGSPQSGYLWPWEPGDESWRDTDPLFALA